MNVVYQNTYPSLLKITEACRPCSQTGEEAVKTDKTSERQQWEQEVLFYLKVVFISWLYRLWLCSSLEKRSAFSRSALSLQLVKVFHRGTPHSRSRV